MDWVIWTGAAISLLGVAGLAWCMVLATRSKRATLSDAARQAMLRKVIVVNVSALALSALGLMLVVTGIMLG